MDWMEQNKNGITITSAADSTMEGHRINIIRSTQARGLHS